MPGNNCYAHGAIEPLPMDMLDAMSVHAKMSLTHSIVTHILKHVNNMGSSASGIGNNKSVVYFLDKHMRRIGGLSVPAY